MASQGYLVLSRHRDESIRTGNGITITVVEIRGDKVRLGISSDDNTVAIHRSEVWDAIVAKGGDPTKNTDHKPGSRMHPDR